jgi:endonuclease/exonuclease/phosphatase family metal-dependent hydrolase
VRLLTFNTLFRGDVRLRLRALGARLEQSTYDVVCLQEVIYRAHVGLLRRAAPSFGHHACSGLVLLQGGLVVLSRRPITRHTFVRYPLTAPARPEYLMRKGAQLVEIDGRTVVNTHLSARHDTRAQRVELTHLAGRLATIDNLVVVGDLNLPRGSAPLEEFRASTGLAQTGDLGHTYRPTAAFPRPPALDHVLVRPPVTATTRLVLQDEVRLADGRAAHLSDHYGIEADLAG